MADKELLKKLSALGFPLFKTDAPQDANKTLADLVKTGDPRLLEGFPVVLANSLEKGLFNYAKVKKNLNNPAAHARLDALLAMSLALYNVLNLKFSWMDQFYKFLPDGSKRNFAVFSTKFKEGKDFKLGEYAMSTERLKNTFNNYFAKAQSRLNNLLSQKEELNLEYALSQVFSPKQKELFLKKLSGEKLTKTEKEYFSRTVKKKVLALANSTLHNMAVRLLS